jgi:hypothetical protein
MNRFLDEIFCAFAFTTRSWVTLIVLIASKWRYKCWKFCFHCSSRVCRLVTAVTWSCKWTCVDYIFSYILILHWNQCAIENSCIGHGLAQRTMYKIFHPLCGKKWKILHTYTHTHKILQTIVAVCACIHYVQILSWILCSFIAHV